MITNHAAPWSCARKVSAHGFDFLGPQNRELFSTFKTHVQLHIWQPTPCGSNDSNLVLRLGSVVCSDAADQHVGLSKPRRRRQAPAGQPEPITDRRLPGVAPCSVPGHSAGAKSGNSRAPAIAGAVCL